LSFFTVGERYRDQYQIETVEPFFLGEWATATVGEEKVYLQHAQLQKPAPPRAIQQYLSLRNHPLILPYTQVFSEERSLVFIRPYVPYRERLDKTVTRGEVDEDLILAWVRSLFPVEEVLKEKPLRMYTLLHPANIGVTEEGRLQVLFCGVDGRTLPNPVIDWGNFLYMLFTRRMLEEPMKKLPPDVDFPKPLGRLIQRSFNRPARYVSSQLDIYEKRRHSKGVLDLFRRPVGKKETSASPPPVPGSSVASDGTEQKSPSIPVYHPEPPSEPSHVLRQRLEQARRAKLETEQKQAPVKANGSNKEEAERQARLRAEQILRKRLERQRHEQEEAERRAQEEAERQARLEAERMERERQEQEWEAEEEAERRAQEEAERQARLEAERMERERQEQEWEAEEEAERRAQEEAERQARLEAERMERERQEQEWEAEEEAERRAQEEAERQARLEAERMERERQEQEWEAEEEAERRAQEEAERQARLEAERMERERQEQDWEAEEEADRRAQEEAERQARLEAERMERERQEQEWEAEEEAERRAQEEAERQARLEAERMEREHLEQLAREEAERHRQQQEIWARRRRLEKERQAHDAIAKQLDEYVKHVFNR
jgi:hypothetical protein